MSSLVLVSFCVCVRGGRCAYRASMRDGYSYALGSRIGIVTCFFRYASPQGKSTPMSNVCILIVSWCPHVRLPKRVSISGGFASADTEVARRRQNNKKGNDIIIRLGRRAFKNWPI